MTQLACVLLVDDDPTTNFLNEALLTHLGVAAHILVAQNGQQALRQLTELAPECPQLILLDVNMPGMNGIQFLEAYRHWPVARRQAIVLMLTSSLHPRDVQRVQALEVVTDFLSKPLTREKVLYILATYFSSAVPAA